MRSARMLLATAAASAVLTIGAPGAWAAGDWDHDDSSYSKDHDNGSKGGEPRGGMHTGGGALALAAEDTWGGSEDKHDSSYKNGGEEKGSWGGGSEEKGSWGGGGEEKGSWGGGGEEKGSWGGGGDKPRGGMHTGGGALDAPAVTAGGLAVLAVAATGMYAVRRKKSAPGMA
ncbi:hypothetical protein [Streptomyces cadmiisoli]|uniref:hypothetical protein n=1 Tax=Streptomyces cadmiisoli TaxID=2184053 RepID=UPI003D70D5AE